MSWELETRPDRISVVLRTPIVGARVVELAKPGGPGFDFMKAMEVITGGPVSSVGEFLRISAETGKAAGVHRQYELLIHKYPLPYVSVYERCQPRHVGLFRWSCDTEPLHSRDERMQLLACKLDEYFQGRKDQNRRSTSLNTNSSRFPSMGKLLRRKGSSAMKYTRQYVIFRESQDEFLVEIPECGDVRLTGWCKHPQQAQRYHSLQQAKKTAQKLASRKGYKLIVCELAETESQIALANPVEVFPLGTV